MSFLSFFLRVSHLLLELGLLVVLGHITPFRLCITEIYYCISWSSIDVTLEAHICLLSLPMKFGIFSQLAYIECPPPLPPLGNLHNILYFILYCLG